MCMNIQNQGQCIPYPLSMITVNRQVLHLWHKYSGTTSFEFENKCRVLKIMFSL